MSAAAPLPSEAAIAVGETRAWVQRAVVGLNLCPFAQAPLANGQVRFVVSDALDPAALLAALRDEMQTLARADPAAIETTLLIHPYVLGDFDDYNDFLDVADAALADLGLVGMLQVASFHPDYRFVDTAPGDIVNATNRAPYPILQLLREASVERAVRACADPDAICNANIRTLEALGATGWAALRAECRRDALDALDAAATSAPPPACASR